MLAIATRVMVFNVLPRKTKTKIYLTSIKLVNSLGQAKTISRI